MRWDDWLTDHRMLRPSKKLIRYSHGLLIYKLLQARIRSWHNKTMFLTVRLAPSGLAAGWLSVMDWTNIVLMLSIIVESATTISAGALKHHEHNHRQVIIPIMIICKHNHKSEVHFFWHSAIKESWSFVEESTMLLDINISWFTLFSSRGASRIIPGRRRIFSFHT